MFFFFFINKCWKKKRILHACIFSPVIYFNNKFIIHCTTIKKKINIYIYICTYIIIYPITGTNFGGGVVEGRGRKRHVKIPYVAHKSPPTGYLRNDPCNDDLYRSLAVPTHCCGHTRPLPSKCARLSYPHTWLHSPADTNAQPCTRTHIIWPVILYTCIVHAYTYPQVRTCTHILFTPSPLSLYTLYV